MTSKYEVLELNKDRYIKLLRTVPSSFESLSVSDLEKGKSQTQIVIIPGNPGIVEFYEYFAEQLHTFTHLPVICISHTNHLFDQEQKIQPRSFPTLKEQINDKITILKRLVFNNKDNNVIFIGHSIGCYIILHIIASLDPEMRAQVKRAFLLFPTVERMKMSPNGKWLTFLAKNFKWFLYLVIFITSKVPNFLRKRVLYWFYIRKFRNNDHLALCSNFLDSVMSFSSSYYSLRSSLDMGHDEMLEVDKLDVKLLKLGGKALVFYFGKKDNWCPMHYYEDMKKLLDEMKGKKGNLKKEETEGKTEGVSGEEGTENLPVLLLDKYNLEHGFVVHQKQCDILVQLITDDLYKSKITETPKL